MDEFDGIDRFINLLFMNARIMLLNDTALQDDCLLVYCVMVCQTRVLIK